MSSILARPKISQFWTSFFLNCLFFFEFSEYFSTFFVKSRISGQNSKNQANKKSKKPPKKSFFRAESQTGAPYLGKLGRTSTAISTPPHPNPVPANTPAHFFVHFFYENSASTTGHLSIPIAYAHIIIPYISVVNAYPSLQHMPQLTFNK